MPRAPLVALRAADPEVFANLREILTTFQYCRDNLTRSFTGDASFQGMGKLSRDRARPVTHVLGTGVGLVCHL